MAVGVRGCIVGVVVVCCWEVVVDCRSTRMVVEGYFFIVEIIVVFCVRLKFMSFKMQEELIFFHMSRVS